MKNNLDSIRMEVQTKPIRGGLYNEATRFVAMMDDSYLNNVMKQYFPHKEHDLARIRYANSTLNERAFRFKIWNIKWTLRLMEQFIRNESYKLEYSKAKNQTKVAITGGVCTFQVEGRAKTPADVLTGLHELDIFEALSAFNYQA